MKHLAACLLLAAGCFNPTYHDPKCGPGDVCPSGLSCYAGTCLAGPPDDARLDDGDIDAPDGPPSDTGPACVGSGAWQLCFTGPAPSASVTVNAAIDTDTSIKCATDVAWTSLTQPAACIIAGANVTVSGTVAVTGSRPLVLLATGTLTMSSTATLDVASHHMAGTIGPASPSSACAVFPQAPMNSTSGAGGAAGSSFMKKGGNGGAGGAGATAGLTQGVDNTAPSILRGGCDGQKGADAASAGGPGGNGGGATYLAAGTSLVLGGTINASGSAGVGATGAIAGGGGGGSGGMIVLWAPAISATTAKAMANGGGGGGGGGASTQGQAGFDPVTNQPTVAAVGGFQGGGGGCGGGNNGRGGNGAALSDATDGNGAASGMCGGGGGGGGGGYIRSNVAIAGLTASPALSVVP